MKTVELFLFGVASLIELALLMALLERINRGRVAIWLKTLVAAVALIHSAIFFRLMLEDVNGQPVDMVDQLLVLCICAGLLTLPSAMLHAATRLHRTGMQSNPASDLRYGLLYLPLLVLPAIANGVITSPSDDFLSLLKNWKFAYLVSMTTANVISIAIFLQLRLRAEFRNNQVFLRRLALAIVMITLLLVVYVGFADGTAFESTIRLLLTLSPLTVAMLFVWHSLREKLFPLVIERTLGYGVMLIGILLAHRLVVSPLAAMLRAKANVDFYLLEGIFVASVILVVPRFRRRVGEALRYLFSTNVIHVRDATRKLSLRLSQNATFDRLELLHWFAGELRESIALEHVAILLDEHSPDSEFLMVTAPCELDLNATRQPSVALRSIRRSAIEWGPILERGSVDDSKLDRDLEAENAILVFRLAYRSVSGIVLLGSRVRYDRLSREQVVSLSLVVDQFAATLHNRHDEMMRQRAERKMLQQEKLSVLGLLSGSLAHELRNPLSSIRTIATLTIEELGSGHPCEHDLRLIVSEIDRLSQTTNRLLDYAKPEPDSQKLVRPDQIISRIVCILNYLARQYHVEMSICLQCDGVSIASNEASLSEIVFNLVKNAIEAVRGIDQGVVRVSTTVVADAILISVTDNGPGIAKELQATLFKPFITYKADGNGLGLYAAAERVRELGGTIRFQSNDSTGTIFEVSVPILLSSSVQC